MTVATPGRAELLALADQIERDGVTVYGPWHPYETVKQMIVDALRLAAKADEDGWQPIEAAKHKDGTRILAWDGKKQFTCYFRGEHHLPHQDKPGWHEQHIRMHPTHWKPLGNPPSTTGEPKP